MSFFFHPIESVRARVTVIATPMQDSYRVTHRPSRRLGMGTRIKLTIPHLRLPLIRARVGAVLEIRPRYVVFGITDCPFNILSLTVPIDWTRSSQLELLFFDNDHRRASHSAPNLLMVDENPLTTTQRVIREFGEAGQVLTWGRSIATPFGYPGAPL